MIPECIKFNSIKSLLAPDNMAYQRKGQNTPTSEMLRPVFMPALNNCALFFDFLWVLGLPLTTSTHFFPIKEYGQALIRDLKKLERDCIQFVFKRKSKR